MRVTVVGLGYVGLVTSACLAEWGHQVVGVDADPRRLGSLREGALSVPISHGSRSSWPMASSAGRSASRMT